MSPSRVCITLMVSCMLSCGSNSDDDGSDGTATPDDSSAIPEFGAVKSAYYRESLDTNVLYLVIVDITLTCADLADGFDPGAAASYGSVTFLVNRLGEGTYEAVSGSEFVSSSGPAAYGSALFFSNDVPAYIDETTGGQLQVDAPSSGNLSGSFDVTFAMGGAAAGSFTAADCPELARMAQNVQAAPISPPAIGLTIR